MRAIAVQPDDDLRRRLDSHLADRTESSGGPSENELLCELLRRGLDAAEHGSSDAGRPATDHEEAIADRVDDVIDVLYASDGVA